MILLKCNVWKYVNLDHRHHLWSFVIDGLRMIAGKNVVVTGGNRCERAGRSLSLCAACPYCAYDKTQTDMELAGASALASLASSC